MTMNSLAAASRALARSSGRLAASYRSAASTSSAASWLSRPWQYSALACRCGISEPAASVSACPVTVFAVAGSPAATASRTASANSSSISSSSSLLSAKPAVSPASEVLGLPGRGEGLLVPVQIAQRDRLVDLEQQPKAGQGRVGLSDGQRPVEQRERLGHVALHRGDQAEHVQSPAHRPVVPGLG